jgi:hypothetical protein
MRQAIVPVRSWRGYGAAVVVFWRGFATVLGALERPDAEKV